MRCLIVETSSSAIGVGVVPVPMNPVTFGVFRTTNQESSVTIMLTIT